MQELHDNPSRCPRCGHQHSAAVDVCAACGARLGVDDESSARWSTVRDSLKTRWVASVIAFWVSAAILAVVSYLEGRPNLILMSICLGLLMVGVWLKTRYQLHLRKQPDRH